MRVTPRRFFTCCITVGMLVVGVAKAPAQTIRSGPTVAVTDGMDERPPIEPHLAIHPTNPQHLLGAAMMGIVAETFREVLLGLDCSSFVSRDDGETWVQHDFALTGCFDPWVTITSSGRAVFIAIGRHDSLPQDSTRLVVFHSEDGGVTWDERPVSLGGGHDHVTVVADRSSAERADWLYVVSSRNIRVEHGRRASVIYVVRSRDGGKTFDEPVYVRPNNLYLKAEIPVVLSDGTLVVSYVDAGLSRRRGWIVRSTDGGYTFSMPNFVNETCGPPFRLSMLAADASDGPFHDRLYFACNLPNQAGVVVNHSPPDGDSWSDDVQVHSAPADSAIQRKVHALAVNDNGVVGVAWYDSRHGRRGECWDVYFAASLDGGESYLPEHRVSEAVSCPDVAIDGDIAGRWGGDYWGMVADADGRFRLFWSDARNGPLQLMTTWVEVAGEVRKPN